MSKGKRLLIGTLIMNILLITFIIISIRYSIKIENKNIAYYYDGLPFFLSLLTSLLSLATYIKLNNSDEEGYFLKEEIFMTFWPIYPLVSLFFSRNTTLIIPLLIISIVYLLLIIYVIFDKERKTRNTNFEVKQLGHLSIILAVIYGLFTYIFIKSAPNFDISEKIIKLFTIFSPSLLFVMIVITYFNKKLLRELTTNSVKLNVSKLFMIISFMVQAIVVLLFILLIFDFYAFNSSNYNKISNAIHLFYNITMISSLVTFIIYLKTNQYDYKKDEIFLLYWSFYPLAIYFISKVYIILLLSIVYFGLLCYNIFFKSKPYEVFYADMKKAGIRIAVTNGVIMAIQIDVILLLNIFEVKENVIWKIFQYVPIPVFIVFLIIHIILIRNYKLASKYEKKIEY